MTGHTVNHISRSSEPPMSNRVVALNSFVLLAREVVSVLLLYRVVALMVFFVDRLPALFVVAKGCLSEVRFASPRRFGETLPAMGYAAFCGWFL